MEWHGDKNAIFPKASFWQKLRLVLRAIAMAFGTVFCVTMFLILRLLDYVVPMVQLSRIPIFLWARLGLFLCGVKLEVRGKHMRRGGTVVANHVSWLDIFTMLGAANISFISKSEVRHWPVIGFMARVTGTMFIDRRRAASKQQQEELLERLKKGDQIAFFPEATSTDGLRVLEFKSTLFSVFHTPDLIKHVWVQPTTLAYIAPDNQPKDFYGWWGDTGFDDHVLAVLALSRGGKVIVTLHSPVRAADFPTRKELAKHCGGVVRQQLADDLDMTLDEVSNC